jgi:hypothetical protein
MRPVTLLKSESTAVICLSDIFDKRKQRVARQHVHLTSDLDDLPLERIAVAAATVAASAVVMMGKQFRSPFR